MKKIAALLQFLGPAGITPLIQELPPPILKKILEIGPQKIPKEELLNLLKNLQTKLGKAPEVFEKDFLQKVLAKLGPDWKRYQDGLLQPGLAPILEAIDDSLLLKLLQYENTRTVAAIVAYLPLPRLSLLAQKGSPDWVASWLCILGQGLEIRPDTIKLLEEQLKRWPQKQFEAKQKKGGIGDAAQLLASLPAEMQERLRQEIAQKEGKLAQELEDEMWHFDDIIYLPQKSWAWLWRQKSLNEWVIALKICQASTRDFVIKSLSKNNQEEFKNLSEIPQRKTDVLKMQKEIIELWKQKELDNEFNPFVLKRLDQKMSS